MILNLSFWVGTLLAVMCSRTVCAGCSKHELPASGVCPRTGVHSQGVGRGPEVKHSQKSPCANAAGLGVAVALGMYLSRWAVSAVHVSWPLQA